MNEKDKEVIAEKYTRNQRKTENDTSRFGYYF